MKCPNCQKSDDFRVIDKRDLRHAIRRRRLCVCGERFTTYEYIAVKAGRGLLVGLTEDLEIISARLQRVMGTTDLIVGSQTRQRSAFGRRPRDRQGRYTPTKKVTT